MNKTMHLLNMNILSQHIGVFDSKKFNEMLNTFYEDDENKQKEPIKKKNSHYHKLIQILLKKLKQFKKKIQRNKIHKNLIKNK